MITRLRPYHLSFVLLFLATSLGLAILLQGCKSRPSAYFTALRAGITPAFYGDYGSDPRGGPKGSAISPFVGTEEVWILARGESPAAAAEENPGTGTLLAKIE